jgi:hypothetical protein
MNCPTDSQDKFIKVCGFTSTTFSQLPSNTLYFSPLLGRGIIHIEISALNFFSNLNSGKLYFSLI